jgi:hypothetical protein
MWRWHGTTAFIPNMKLLRKMEEQQSTLLEVVVYSESCLTELICPPYIYQLNTNTFGILLVSVFIYRHGYSLQVLLQPVIHSTTAIHSLMCCCLTPPNIPKCLTFSSYFLTCQIHKHWLKTQITFPSSITLCVWIHIQCFIIIWLLLSMSLIYV